MTASCLPDHDQLSAELKSRGQCLNLPDRACDGRA